MMKQKNYTWKTLLNNKNIYWFDSKKYKCLDSNVNRSVELCSSNYVWIFGDDDIIEAGILSSLITYLKKVKPEILVLNSKSFINSQVIEEARMPIKDERIYRENENDTFLKEMGSYLTYIGAIVVKRGFGYDHMIFKNRYIFFSHSLHRKYENRKNCSLFPIPSYKNENRKSNLD